MSCNSVKTKLSSYVDGEMSAAELQQVKRHVASCPDCYKQLEQFRGVRTSLRDLDAAPEAPSDLPDRVLRTIKSSRTNYFKFAFALAVPVLLAAMIISSRTPKPISNSDRDLTIKRQLAKDRIFDAGTDPTSGASLVHYTSFEGR